MLSSGSVDSGSKTPAIDAPLRSQCDSGSVALALAQNELLFETGDIKSKIYRIEAGSLCIYRTRPDLTIEVIEHALAGDFVGMGFLERHAANARATVETRVSCFPLEALDRLIENNAHAKARFDDAVEREFVFRRESLVSSARDRPMVRLAAFLIAVSNRSREEGGDPTLIDDSVDCGVIADFLGLSVDLLALALMQLEMRGLVETAPAHSLRLKDLAALEEFANEQIDAPAWLASDDELRATLQ